MLREVSQRRLLPLMGRWQRAVHNSASNAAEPLPMDPIQVSRALGGGEEGIFLPLFNVTKGVV